MGNITRKSGQGTYAYDAATDRLNSVGAHAYTYDDNGNVLTDGERTLTWTPQNKVRSLDRGGQSWSVLYDAEGTRVVREEAAANSATYNVGPTYELRFDGANLVEARISVLASTGRVVAEVFAERTALEDDNSLWENRKKFVHDDHLGSTHAVTDGDGAVESRVMYGPWGAAWDGENWFLPASETSLDELPAGFTGHQPELDAGLINMRGRMYDPAVGRFMSVDPVIENALEVGTWNAYSYVQNRPLSLVDPTGLASEDRGGKLPPPDKQAFAEMDAALSVLDRGNFAAAEYGGAGSFVLGESTPRVEDEVAKADARKGVEVQINVALSPSLASISALLQERSWDKMYSMRPLTDDEEAFLRFFFGDRIPYDEISLVGTLGPSHVDELNSHKIHVDIRHLTSHEFEVVSGHIYVFNEGEIDFKDITNTSVLAHEAYHLLQRGQGRWVTPVSYFWQAMEMVGLADDPYAIIDASSTTLTSMQFLLRVREMGVEGQAEQFQDYVERFEQGKGVSVYQDFAACTKGDVSGAMCP